MGAIFNIINVPLGYIVRFIADFFGGNFAVSVLVFTFLINLALIPLSIKSQKSTVQQTRIKPKLDELKKKYGDDKQKYNAAMQQLYQEENVSMSGGCLPMIVRLVIMMSIYWLILSPLTYMAGANKTKVENVNDVFNQRIEAIQKSEDKADKEIAKMLSSEYGIKSKQTNQLGLIRIIRSDDDNLMQEILTKKQYKKIAADYKAIKAADQKNHISYELFGIDLTETPKFSFDFKLFKPIWLIPICAFLSQILTSLITVAIQKKNNPEAPSMMGMMLTMPLITLFIGFGLPGGVGFYWICSSLIGGLLQSAIQVLYGPHKLLAVTRAKEMKAQIDFELKQLGKFTETLDK